VVRLQHAELGAVDEPIQVLRAVLALAPEHIGVLDALASLLQTKGAWGEMIEVMRRRAALERDPAVRAARFLSVADLLEAQEGDLAGAIDAYRAALEADPRSPQAQYSLDALYRRCALWPELIDLLYARVQSSVDADQQLAWLLEIGQLFEEELGDAEQAAEAYRGALELEPACVTALRGLERVCQALGDLDGAIALCDQQLALAPEDADAIYGRMEALYREAGAWEALVELYGEHALVVEDPARKAELESAMAEARARCSP
jgi:tetratricopeptide (TPR) repeat protein